MCGRLSFALDSDEARRRFDAEFDHDHRPRYNVAPRDALAVIPDDREDTITRQEWGLIPPRADDPGGGPRPINARAETLAETPAFRDAFEHRRCLVLADGFYEWQSGRGHTGAQPHRVHVEGGDAFAMAGIWEPGRESAPETVAVVTAAANEVVEPIHDRMPVILERGREAEWLRAGTADVAGLLAPYPGDDLRAHPVSTRVNDPANDGPEVVAEVDPGEQTGLDDFGA